MYPFLFYGSRPGDWFEGANMGHLYELRFAAPPTAAQRAALAECWGRETAIGNVDPGPWRWAGAWALVCVGERRISETDAMFRKISGVLGALHEVHPLAEVVFWGARGDTDNDWESWTLQQQATPTAGPAWPGYAPMSWYGQGRDAALPTGAPDPEFARAAAAAAAAAPPPEREPEPELVVNDSPATDLADAVGRAEKFLEDYTTHGDYYDDDEPRVWMQYTSADGGAAGIEVLFCCHSDPEDQDLVALCERAIGALRAANPNLGFAVSWSLSD